MNQDLTVYISLATAFAAIVAPIITSFLQAKYSIKLAKINTTLEKQMELSNQFSMDYIRCGHGKEKTGYIEIFFETTMKLIPLSSKKVTRHYLFLIAETVRENGTSDYSDKLFKKCITLLSKEY